jgi:hypothetical protein
MSISSLVSLVSANNRGFLPSTSETINTIAGSSSGFASTTLRTTAPITTLGTSTFTIEFWMRTPSDPGSVVTALFGYGNSNNTSNPNRLTLFYNFPGNINRNNLLLQDSGTSVGVNGEGSIYSAGLANNTWYYVAIVKNASNVISMYVNNFANGQITVTDSGSSGWGKNYSSTNFVLLTPYANINGNNYQGLIRGYKVSNNVRYATRPTTNPTTFSTDSNTTMLLTINSTTNVITDVTNNHTITNNNALVFSSTVPS